MPLSTRPHYTVPLPDGTALSLGARTLVMGIVNVTPDSFAGAGATTDPGRAIERALRLVDEGADILDVGGESTRPGAAEVPADEEWRRVEPVLAGLRGKVSVPVSIDTYKASVALRALDLGATIVNDISGFLYEPPLAEVVARQRAAVVLMHTRGRSRAMYAEAEYRDVVDEVTAELQSRVAVAEAAGIARERIIIDPGLGFAKRAEDSMKMLAGLPGLATLGLPILSGPSRKSFLKLAVGDVPPDQRVWATAGAVVVSILLGAHIVRVHDVKEIVQVVRVADALANRSIDR